MAEHTGKAKEQQSMESNTRGNVKKKNMHTKVHTESQEEIKICRIKTE